METKTIEENTGSGASIIQGRIPHLNAFVNIEFPNGENADPFFVGGRNVNEPENHLINISLFCPYEGEERDSRLDDLSKAREVFETVTGIRGLYSGEFNEEEFSEDDALVEQTYKIPFNNQEELQSILQNIRGISILSGSFSTQLEQLFAGKLDQGTLEKIVLDVDSELHRVTTQTGSTGVVSFQNQGRKGYGKVSTNQQALENEDRALNRIQQDNIARVLAPIPIGLASTENAGALFTWGTENRDLYNEEDIKQYEQLFNSMIFQYAQKKDLDGKEFSKLVNDPLMRDVFNRAIIHSSTSDFQSLNPRPSIVEVEKLNERANTGSPTLQDLRKYAPVYEDASKRIQNLNPGNQVFLHGDARPENVGQDPRGVRPLIDWANSKMGTFAEDFAALESPNSEQYLDWYSFVLNSRGVEFNQEDSKELVTCYNVLQPYRTATFKIGHGREQDARRDIQRLDANARKYRERFG